MDAKPLPSSIESPIYPNTEAKLIEIIDRNFIVEKYKGELKIDPSDQFKSTKQIGIYHCPNSGYRFFHPPSIAGDGMFYNLLNESRPYYHQWNWEQAAASNYISEGDKVLDVGCGEGSYLNDILKRKTSITCVGIDINESAIEEAKRKGINAISCTPEQLLQISSDKFDVITAFQVLEHIHDVSTFMRSLMHLLKPQGKIIISVPNNDPYYDTYEKYNVLNLPPHHMGWWNKKSLLYLGGHLNLIPLVQIYEEVFSYKRKLRFKYQKNLLMKVWLTLIPAFIFKILFRFIPNEYKGFGILTIYQKKL